MGGAALTQSYQAGVQRAALGNIASRGAAMAGGLSVDNALTNAGMFGLGASELLSLRLGFQSARGASGANIGATAPIGTRTMANLSLGAGVGVGTLGALSGLEVGRGGAFNADTVRSVQLGVEAGFKGAKLEQFLSSMVGAVQSLQTQGLPVDIREVLNITAGLTGAGVQSTAIMPFMSSGMGMIGQARQQLLSPFRQLGQMSIMAQALRGGGGFRGALGRIEEMSTNPNLAFGGSVGAIADFAGPMSDLVYSAMGLSGADASRVAGMNLGLSGTGRRGHTVTAHTDAFASELARHQARTISKYSGTADEFKELLTVMENLKDAVSSFEGVGRRLATAIDGPLKTVLETAADGFERVIDLLPR